MAWPDGVEPPMPANLPAIFGSTASTPEELQVFKAELLHAFHCRTPSCPISGCTALSAKLQRLQVHMGSCTEETCLLCGIGSYLRTYNAAVAVPTDAASDALGGSMHYMNELLMSRQRLPTYDRETGGVSWMNPREAIETIRSMTGLPMPSHAGAPAAADMEPAAKRQRGAVDGMSGFSALGSYPGLLQGVIGGANAAAWGGMQSYTDFSAPGAMPRVPQGAAAGKKNTGAADPHRDFASMAAEMVDGIGGMYEPFGGNAGGLLGRRRGGGAGGSGGGFDGSLGNTNGLMDAGFPLSSLSKSRSALGMSSGNINLQDLIKTNSLSDLGLGLGLMGGNSMADFGNDIGLSLTKSKSELKEGNASNFSLSGLLGEGASEIVSGLAKTTKEANLSGGLSMRMGSGSDLAGRSEGLLDIMGEFGPSSTSSAPQISAK